MPYGGRYLRMAAGDPGLFGSVFKAIGGVVSKVAPKLLGAIPGAGLVAAIAPTAMKLGQAVVRGRAGAVAGIRPMGPPSSWTPPVGGSPFGWGRGAVLTGAGALGGATIPGAIRGTGPEAARTFEEVVRGRARRRYRRMNPMNPRAARRAIRRIKAVRKITRDIESALPKKSSRGSTRPFFARRKK